MARIRINEKILREIISRALISEAAPNKTDRKTNRRVFSGDFKQLTTKDDNLSEQLMAVPSSLVIVKVNEKGESGCYNEITDEFLTFVESGGLYNKDADPGIRHYKNMLNGTVNQLYGQPLYLDTLRSKGSKTLSRKHGDEPFDIERGIGKVPYSAMGKNSELCPFEYNEKGYVCVKPGMEDVVDDFLVYKAGDAEIWEYATFGDGVFKFFFSSSSDRINFVRQINNMFNIARRTLHRDPSGERFTNSFRTQPTTPVLIVEQYDGINPLDYVDVYDDAEFVSYVNDLFEQQEFLKASKDAANPEGDSVVDQPEDMEDTPSMGLNTGEQPSVEPGKALDDDNEEINECGRGRKKITESQLRKLIRGIIMESLGC